MVGMRFHAGGAGLAQGEVGRLVREPTNKHDPNAIAVLNAAGVQVGHLARDVAAVLGPLIDRHGMTGGAACAVDGRRTGKALDLDVTLMGPSGARTPCVSALRAAGASVRDSAPAPAPPAALAALSDLEVRLARPAPPAPPRPARAPPRRRRRLRTRAACAAAGVPGPLLELLTGGAPAAAAMPEGVQPAGVRLRLRRHQLQALHWMLAREAPEGPGRPPRGGILADEPGLGKRTVAVALAVADRRGGQAGSAGTLLLAPRASLAHWRHVLGSAVEPGALSYAVLEGGAEAPRDLASPDLVLAAHEDLAIATAEGGPAARLLEASWCRVLVDDAHALGGASLPLHPARALAHRAQRCWLLTSTPLRHSVDDLQPLLCILGVPSLGDENGQEWARLVTLPLKTGAQEPFARLQALLGALMLRRTREHRADGRPLADIPPRTLVVRPVLLPPDHLELYRALWAAAEALAEGLLAAGRACELAAHDPSLANVLPEPDPLAEQRGLLLGLLAGSPSEACAACAEPALGGRPLAAPCGHPVCAPAPPASSPPARTALAPAPATDPEQPAAAGAPGAKLAAAVEEVRGGAGPALLVSHFPAVLRAARSALEAAGIRAALLTGTAGPAEAARALAPPPPAASPRALLATVQTAAGATPLEGLDLTPVSTVLLLEPPCSPRIQERILARVHRAGQGRPVRLVRLVAEGTVDNAMEVLQNRRRGAARSVLAMHPAEIWLDALTSPLRRPL
eukprot:tig00001056_g6624.t1